MPGLPDLIVLDWTMPKRTGSRCLQQVRKIGSVPVIMLTAHWRRGPRGERSK